MKKIFAVLFAVTFSFSAFSQKISVKESKENIGGGSHTSLTVTLYSVDPSDAEDSFKSFMKKYGGKRSTKGGEVVVSAATIKGMSDNTINIYGKANGKKGDAEITFIIAFDLGASYLNSSDHGSQFKIAEKIVLDFAIKATQDAIKKELKEAEKVLSKKKNEQNNLEKEKDKLKKDIENYKEKIKKAESDIVTNDSDQAKKKNSIKAQKKVVEDIKVKLGAVK